ERIVTIQEGGKPAQRCRVLRTWQQPDGSRAHQVQALDTGEMMTVEESGVASTATNQKGLQVKAVTTRIFHWGPAPNTPHPPPDARVMGDVRPVTPGPAPFPQATVSVTFPAPPAGPPAPAPGAVAVPAPAAATPAAPAALALKSQAAPAAPGPGGGLII